MQQKSETNKAKQDIETVHIDSSDSEERTMYKGKEIEIEEDSSDFLSEEVEPGTQVEIEIEQGLKHEEERVQEEEGTIDPFGTLVPPEIIQDVQEEAHKIEEAEKEGTHEEINTEK